jgi:predicted TIM-barrel fold metal-dependent hydrolase
MIIDVHQHWEPNDSLDGFMTIDFPNINIIATHCGWRWWPELAGIMEWK